MDINNQKLKPVILLDKPIVDESYSDSESSTDSKKSEENKSKLSAKSKGKSPLKRSLDRTHRRSRSREHHKHESHKYRNDKEKRRRRKSSSRSRSRENRHKKHHKHRRDSSRTIEDNNSSKYPKKSSQRSPRRRSSRSPRNDYSNDYKRRNYKDDLKSRYRSDDDRVDHRARRARQEQQHAQERVKKAEELHGITLPKFYNPSAINPIKFAETQQKRKLLWSKKTDPSEENQSVWNVTSVLASGGDDRGTAKFKKLMGIHNDGQQSDLTELTKKAEEQAELFRRLDADYQSARNHTHTARGVGLGYNQSVFIDPAVYMAGRRDNNNN